MSNYLLDRAGNPYLVEDIREWGRGFETLDTRVALTKVNNAEVSTIFLGLDHNFSSSGPPVLWETMVFGGWYNDSQERYTSREEAITGHNRWVERASIPFWKAVLYLLRQIARRRDI